MRFARGMTNNRRPSKARSSQDFAFLGNVCPKNGGQSRFAGSATNARASGKSDLKPETCNIGHSVSDQIGVNNVSLHSCFARKKRGAGSFRPMHARLA
jgi:hypothetical protein